MAVYGYTKNYKLIKPQFDTDTWHDYEYDNLDTIDAVLSAIFASGDWQGFWKTNTHYDAGGVVIDRDTDTMYKIMVEHTTSEDTFAEEQTAHPTYYELWSPNNLAEDWAIKMDGIVSNTDYSSKAYAISSALIDNGSAKEWAINSGTIGTTGEYSAKKYATDAHNDYIGMTTDSNVVAVGTNIASVNTVGQSISNVNTVAGDISSVNTVAGISTDVTTVASISAAVSTVSDIESDVLDVSDNRTDISTVATNITDVNTVAGVAGDVSTVADNDANVTTVATNISDVNTAATNIAAIQAAPTAASNAAASATLAQEWATKMDGQVASTDYSSKYYAGQSATSAQAAQDALDNVHGLIATPIGTIFQSVYVDESMDIARHLNGQLISSTKFHGFRDWLDDVQAAIPNLFTTEVNWQAEKALSKFGQIGKFVIDDENNTIRLPAIVNAQGLLGLSGIGNLVNESLPNITGTAAGNRTPYSWSHCSGAFYGAPVTTVSGTEYGAGADTGLPGYSSTLAINASRSSSTYQNSAPVQQEAIQYPYYIQVATGVEETLPAIREYKVNNSDYFGKSMYSENAPYNASWLASNGQYNASTLYPDFWTQLTGVELNGSLNVGDMIEISGKTYVKRGLPVVLSTGTITDYDFVVDQDNSQFRLPLKNGEEDLPGSNYENWTLGNSGTQYTAPCNGTLMFSKATTASGQYIQLACNSRLETRWSSGSQNLSATMELKRGQTAQVYYAAAGTTNVFSFFPAVGNGTLYYYVGDTVQDASLINAGAVLNTLSGKIGYDDLTTVHCVVETYQSGNSWYRVYDDGWVEQGGTYNNTALGQTVSFLKTFANTNYTITLGGNDTDGSAGVVCFAWRTKATTGFVLDSGYNGTFYGGALNWFACGYGA